LTSDGHRHQRSTSIRFRCPTPTVSPRFFAKAQIAHRDILLKNSSPLDSQKCKLVQYDIWASDITMLGAYYLQSYAREGIVLGEHLVSISATDMDTWPTDEAGSMLRPTDRNFVPPKSRIPVKYGTP
jgi:hypothetical protein